jgi:hypothetical protein
MKACGQGGGASEGRFSLRSENLAGVRTQDCPYVRTFQPRFSRRLKLLTLAHETGATYADAPIITSKRGEGGAGHSPSPRPGSPFRPNATMGRRKAPSEAG